MLPGPGPVYTAYDSSNIESGAPFEASCLVAASYTANIYSIVTIFKC